MEMTRKPFQGILNIVRFNWHFYAIAFALGIGFLTAICFTRFTVLFGWALLFLAYSFLVSLAVSCWIYDFTGFYSLDWLDKGFFGKSANIVNIHAGFDETSAILRHKFPDAKLTILDFYDPAKHTEISIQRARKKYPPFPGTVSATTSRIPIRDNSIDLVFLVFSAHEIREFQESRKFFGELHRILAPDGKIILIEHLRDLPNSLAYTVGVFHFFPKSRWLKIIDKSNFVISAEQKLTPFTTSFILAKNGNTP